MQLYNQEEKRGCRVVIDSTVRWTLARRGFPRPSLHPEDFPGFQGPSFSVNQNLTPTATNLGRSCGPVLLPS